MDITLMMDDIQFNVRVAAFIRKGQKILVEKAPNNTYFSLPGGRVKIGEDSILALKREIKEEMNEDIEFVKSRAMIENFYNSKYTNGPCHEILFILEMKFKKEQVYLKDEIPNLEDNGAIFKWIEIEELKRKEFKPEEYKKYLEIEEFKHIINRD